MALFSKVICAFLLCYVFGTILVVAPSLVPAILTLCGCAFVVSCMLRRWGITLVICVACLAVNTGYWHASSYEHSLQPPGMLGKHTTISGTIRDPPAYKATTTRVIVSNPQYSSSVLVTIPVWPPVSKGDHITVTGLLEPIENFDSFDYRRWLAGKGVVSSLEAKSFEMWSTTPYTVTNILERCRSWISWRIRTLLPNPEAAFLQGLLLGDDDGLPESLIAALRHTGTSHLTAISGANIAIVLTLLTPLLPFRKRHHTFIASCAIAFGIAVMTGASASVVRGAVVVVLGGLITLLGLPGNTTMLLALALAAMTVVNPLAPSSDPSFQLSFAAFAGLGYFSQPISFLMQKIAPALPPWLKAPIQETTAASLGSVPVAGMVMGQWNWYGLIVNPLVLPFIPLATAAGGVLCIGFGLETILTLPTWLLLTTPLRIISHLGGSRW